MIPRLSAGLSGQTATSRTWQYLDMRAITLSLSSLAALALSACQVGPNYAPPAAPVGAGYAAAPLPPKTAAADVAGGQAQTFAQGRDVAGRWWTLYGSAELDVIRYAA